MLTKKENLPRKKHSNVYFPLMFMKGVIFRCNYMPECNWM
jgi:hypothetical protein